MKKILYTFILIIFSLSASANNAADSTEIHLLVPESQHKRACQIITHILSTNHYHKKNIDDTLSTEIFDLFLEKLDYNRLYFLDSDIQSFQQYRFDFDDYIKTGSLSMPYEMFNVYQQRVIERLRYALDRLKTDFDYTIDESYEIDRSEAPWAKSKADLDELWRQRLKAAALNLKLSGKSWEKTSETLQKRYKRILKNVSQFQSEDVFQIVMNSFSETFDPHTNYFSPKNFDNFKINMSQAFEGIGARLSMEDDYTTVSEIIPGGPADKGNQLFPNDKIIGVAQGDDGDVVDVIGWRLDDVVQLIRGKKGTTVRLQIIAADAGKSSPPDTISIIRDKIKLQDQTAKSDTLDFEYEGKKFRFGVITIPTFYSDFDGRRNGDPDYKSTSRDVKKLLGELESANVDGIIIDLRRNGGGFLNEAVDLTGLFIDEGPVVQVRGSDGNINVEWDREAGTVYDGPLAVIINRYSASASEIFAAAIQDYHRGVILGGQSFGKGTVQRPIDLNQVLRNQDDLFGQIKLTTAKFYRVNGGSTQHLGVTPDISLPSRYTYMEVGESSSQNALRWDQIKPLNYNSYSSDIAFADLSTRHKLRMTNDAEYKEFLDELSEFEEDMNRKTLSLNYEIRKAEQDKLKDKKLLEEEDEDEEMPKDKEKKDILLEESARVLGDYILLSKKN